MMDNIVILSSLATMYAYYYFALRYAKSILARSQGRRWDCAVLAVVNVAIHYGAYIIDVPYEFMLLSVGFAIMGEFKLISNASIRQIFFGTAIFTFNIVLVNVLTLVCMSHILGISALAIFEEETLFMAIKILEYLILIALLKIISAIVPIGKLRGMSSIKAYSEVMSITAAVMTIYICISLWVSLTYELYLPHLISIAVSAVVIAVAFYCLFFFNLKLINLHSFKRKSDRADIIHKKNIEKHSQVLRKLYTDPLTGCYNKLFIEQKLDEFCADKDIYFGVLYCDLVSLKAVNDNYGHKEGDRYIIGVANALNKSVRSEDFIARVGGDEFIVLLYNIMSTELDKVVMRVLQNIEEENAKTEFTIHANLGCIYLGEDGESRDKLDILEKADKLMQENKREYYAKVGVK